MERVKTRIFAGAVCEQYVYNRRSGAQGKSLPRPRFRDEDERAAHRDGISRRRNARLINNSFGPTSYYSTLTFSAEWEVHTAADCRRERDAFYRRLRRRYPEAKIYIVYGQGKHTARYHLHLITDGIPPEEIVQLWGRGDVADCRALRRHNWYRGKDGILRDHGQDYTGLANYLFGHWQPKFGGHRWKATKNCRLPEPEEPQEVKRKYTVNKPPRPPKGYVLTEARQTAYGYIYYKYVAIPEEGLGKDKQGRRGRPDDSLVNV